MVGSSLRLTMAVLPPAPVLLPVSAGTGWNALISMATLFSPMPRNPPTPTISPRILPFLSNSMSLTLPMCALSGPRTSVPLNLEKTHWSVPCAAMNFAVSCGMASTFAAGAAGCFGDISACARAPETISALTAAEIIRVLSICGLRSFCSVKEKKPSLPGNNSRAQPCVPCIGNLACAAASGFGHCKPAHRRGGRARQKLTARFPPYSEEREQFSAALYGTSEVLKIDGEGRAILTEPLKTHAGIKDEIAFAGLGHKFQIWEPGRFRAELAEATEKVRALTKQLGSRVAAEGPHGARE